jgi:DNA polymerase III sliding clamp (beta) subunit (PCNA family)
MLIEATPHKAAQVTIPNEAIKTLAGTAKNGDEWLHFTVDGVKIHVLTGNNEYTFQAVDGNFPDCDRVIPLVLKKEDEAPAGFNPEYLMAFQLAAQDIKSSRKGANPSLSILQRGSQSALVNIGVDNFIGVVMPVRDGVGASVPEWCYKARKATKETEAVAA